MINQVARANANTVTVTPVASITAPAITQEGSLLVFHTRDAAAGEEVSPNAFNTVVRVEKTSPASVIAVAASVNIDIATQKQVDSGGVAAGTCVKASTATDKYVDILLNSI